MSPLQSILATYRSQSKTEREKGSYFEELIRTYFRFEATYADLYSHVWLYSDWAKEIGTPEFGISGKDTGIDLVAKTHGTEEYHAIQCKCYAEDYTVKKADIDSFFTASGQKPFTQRIIVTTTNDWSENAENSLNNQTPPVYKIDLHDLETSQIDWAKYQPTAAAPVLKPKKELRPHQTSAKGKVVTGLESADRGKLIMACGTGKTFTSLKIAEEVAGKDKRVLFLVPSLNLLSQTLTEWTQESAVPLHSFAVCSDVEVGKNPPYSAGQESANDNNQNVAYPDLDARIRNTYAEHSTMTSVKNLYDSYIRAIRWASDRLGDCGVIGFVTNAGFLEANTADGMRKCLAEEFSDTGQDRFPGRQPPGSRRSCRG